MADLKLSELSAASSLNDVDTFLLTQAGTSKSISSANLSKFLSTKIANEATDVVSSGALSLSVTTSALSATTVQNVYTLAAGTHGKSKFLICTTTDVTTPSAIVNVTSGSMSSITFNNIGDSITLINVDGIWYPTGPTGIV